MYDEAGDLWLRQKAPKRLRLGIFGQDQNSRLSGRRHIGEVNILRDHCSSRVRTRKLVSGRCWYKRVSCMFGTKVAELVLRRVSILKQTPLASTMNLALG